MPRLVPPVCSHFPAGMTADHACDAKLVIVGEAPGRREDEQGIPFVGAAGALLERWWEPLGLHRADFAIYNVYPYRPPANKIQAIPRDAIEFWSERLRERIAALADPVVLVPMGNVALRALFPGEDMHISDWRGSILGYTDARGRVIKVIPTIHPAATFRQAILTKFCLTDWERISEDRHFRELRIPKIAILTEPTADEFGLFMEQLRLARENTEWPVMAVDIENDKNTGELLCVGFAYHPSHALVLPLSRRALFTSGTRDRMLSYARALCSDPIPKVLQNGQHDQYILRANGVSLANYQYDLMEMDHCLTGDTMVLTTGCTWMRLDCIREGDEIIGVDEEPLSRQDSAKRFKRHRRLTHGVVTATSSRIDKVFRVGLSNGTFLRGTKNHRVLTGAFTRSGRREGGAWREIGELKPGDEVYSVGQPWALRDDFRAGWVAGVFDGEGSLGVYNHGPNHNNWALRIGFTQNPGTVLMRTKAMLVSENFDFYEHKANSAYSAINLQSRGGIKESLRFLGTFGPVRLLQNFKNGLKKHGWNGVSALKGDVTVVSVEEVGEVLVYDISTTNRTFFANGVVVHNCLDPNDGGDTQAGSEGASDAETIRISMRSLAVLASLHTRFPYYKKGGRRAVTEFRWQNLYDYCGMDNCVTRTIFPILLSHLIERGLVDQSDCYSPSAQPADSLLSWQSSTDSRTLPPQR